MSGLPNCSGSSIRFPPSLRERRSAMDKDFNEMVDKLDYEMRYFSLQCRLAAMGNKAAARRSRTSSVKLRKMLARYREVSILRTKKL